MERRRRGWVLRLERVGARRLVEEGLRMRRREEVVGGEVGMVRREVLVVLVVGQVVREVLGAARVGQQGGLVVRLRLRGDAGLEVNRVWRRRRILAEEGVEGLGGAWGEHRRSVREVRVRQQRWERMGQHVREGRRREVLRRVLLHVHPMSPGVLRRVYVQIRGRPGVLSASPFLRRRVCPRVCRRSR